MKYFLSFLVLALVPMQVFADEQETQVIKVNEGLHMIISPMGGNVAVSSGEDGVFIVDDQLAGRSEIINALIKETTGQDVKFVLNTHYHFDHTGGNEHFGKSDAIIVAHDNVRERLSTKQFISFFGKEMNPMPKEGLPVVTFSGDMSLHYNGDDVKIIHLPNAHTDGDAAAHFVNDNVIVAGDIIFNGMYPFIDVEHGGSIKGVIEALSTLINLSNDETKIIPGHGTLMTKVDAQAYHDVMVKIHDKIEAAVKSGGTKEEVIAMKPTEEFDEAMGNGIVGPDDFVAILYENIKSNM